MTKEQTFVIVGASLAGAKAAETLRDEGFDGRVVLIGDEPTRPYERPPLSKGFLRGEVDFDVAAVHDEDYYEKRGIELRTATTATGVDPLDSSVTLAGSERLAYDRLLLTTGAVPRRISVRGAELGGVHYLRTVADSTSLHEAITAGGPLVVIGAGWIGAEVAASARQLGAEVAIVELAGVPLERVLGPEVGARFGDLHASHGVDLHFGVGVEALHGTAGVEEVELSDGTRLPAATVVVGVGVLPRTELAETAGLALDNGIVVDEYLASSVPQIFAAGDVANAFHPFYDSRIRLEHWSAALNQGPTAARNMLGMGIPYERIPYFFSDQYDLGMEYTGWAPAFDEVLIREEPAEHGFVAFWLKEKRLQAAMHANVWDATKPIEALIGSRRALDASALVDNSVDLAELANA